MGRAVDVQALVRDINEALILAVLRDGAKHGYQIALDVEERSGGMFTFQHGTLYPILHRLEKEGRIEGKWSTAEGRRRKEYRPTRRGREWMAEQEMSLREVFGTLIALLEGE
ncbi:MAG: PadR family transcriptional regulator [Gemmatimonadota bacterium]